MLLEPIEEPVPFMHLTDGYKLDHRRQYPKGTQAVMSNYTARASRISGQTHVTFFWLQAFLQEYFMERVSRDFFSKPKGPILEQYQDMLNGYFGPNNIGTQHISDLHDLGYLPLRFKALPEGSAVPLGVPMFTIENTDPRFFWLTNYFETLISSCLWMPITSATTAARYRKILNAYAEVTTGSTDGVQWQGHDFSFRGMGFPEAARASGCGHLLSFTGTDTLPAIDMLKHYYDAQGLIGASVPATEHSVMCAGGQENELETYLRLLELYPSGFLSVVSDTWNLWDVLTVILPKLHDKIMARQGKLVIRPDSGDPVLIICGDPQATKGSRENKGVVQLLWEEFGGKINTQGYKVLDSHIGAIYGDSITEQRASDICARLAMEKFASTNVVFGIGSYTYQLCTRDTHSQVIKATHTTRDNQSFDMQKDPVTGSGKKSARGRLAVSLQLFAGSNKSDFVLLEGERGAEVEGTNADWLSPVWENGRFLRRQSLGQIRAIVEASIGV